LSIFDLEHEGYILESLQSSHNIIEIVAVIIMGLWITGIVMKEIYEKYEKFSKTLSNATNNYARYKKMPKIVTIIRL